MRTDMGIDLERLSGLDWYPNGQSVLSGPLLQLYHRFDRLFLRWAAEVKAQEVLVPTFIPTAELARLDYFHSFPQLVTFPVTLDPAEDNLRRFVADGPLAADGAVRLAGCAPVHDALTPAACYHFYVLNRGQQLGAPRYLTTRATCFRREAYYAPLQRQWSFSMREIVCIGTADEVKTFLAAYQARLDRFFQDTGLPINWAAATDSFFRPAHNPKYLAQRLDPVKTEMVFPVASPDAVGVKPLAIGSINFHRNYFGEAFGITRAGQDAFTGCVAFGLERWLFAWLTRFGTEPNAGFNLNRWDGDDA